MRRQSVPFPFGHLQHFCLTFHHFVQKKSSAKRSKLWESNPSDEKQSSNPGNWLDTCSKFNSSWPSSSSISIRTGSSSRRDRLCCLRGRLAGGRVICGAGTGVHVMGGYVLWPAGILDLWNNLPFTNLRSHSDFTKNLCRSMLLKKSITKRLVSSTPSPTFSLW